MDGSRLDELTRALADRSSRRSVVKALVGGMGGGLVALSGRSASACGSLETCCSGQCVNTVDNPVNRGGCGVVCSAAGCDPNRMFPYRACFEVVCGCGSVPLA